MKFPLYIAKRYLFTKSENNAINIISKIASLGVIVGSLLLLVILSGFEGLKTFTLSFTSIVDPDYKVYPLKGKQLQFTNNQLQELNNLDGVINYSKVIEENVFAQFKDKHELAIFKAVDENYNNTVSVDSTLYSGQWLEPKSNQAVACGGIAYKLQLGVLNFTDFLELNVPKPGKGQVNQNTFNKIKTQNVGLLDINEDLNQKLIYISLTAGQELLGYDNNTISYIELKTKKGVDETFLKSKIQHIFNNQVKIKNRIELNDALHKMLNTENIAAYLIATLILIIALFNVIGAIIMMIIDKKKDMKTLHDLGTSLKDIKKIFFLQGSLLTFLGGGLGVLIGVLLIGSQVIFEFIKIPGTNIAYPIDLTLKNIVIVLITVFILGLSASKIASYRISKKLISE
ncbi:ABC transporter permease [Pseudofulvibacter geojedonensis]|uniref:ABC transporter permease n=1 Tax=Pseudofulvibacter geojedonensis TaxID=1123758 RepID=A0ABW3I191_9FLAO